MKAAIVLPFEELTVQVAEEDDMACLVRIHQKDGSVKKQTVVGRKSLYWKVTHVKTEDGDVCVTPPVIPVVEVISRE